VLQVAHTETRIVDCLTGTLTAAAATATATAAAATLATATFRSRKQQQRQPARRVCPIVLGDAYQPVDVAVSWLTQPHPLRINHRPLETTHLGAT